MMDSILPPWATWDVFPSHDDGGMANHSSPNSALEAAKLVRSGQVFNLDYPLDAFEPSMSGRPAPSHNIVHGHPNQLDDYLDGFYLQCSSHVDGLRHRRHHEHGFYAGTDDTEIVAGRGQLGVQVWAERPFVGRGVLVDVARYRRKVGRPLNHAAGDTFSVRELDAAMEAQGVKTEQGDIMLIHSGWANWYLCDLSFEERRNVVDSRAATGLEGTQETIEWFYDARPSLAASDTFALEVYPPRTPSSFGHPHEEGFIHQELIGMLGLPIGEQWLLNELAEHAERSGTYEFMTICKPLNLVGGVGSPANALAIA